MKSVPASFGPDFRLTLGTFALEQAVAVARHHLGETGVFFLLELRQFVFHGLPEDLGIAHADVAAAGFEVDFPLPVRLQRQIFGVGLGETFDPAVEGMVGHRIAQRAAETVPAVPLFTIIFGNVRIVHDERKESFPGVILGMRGGKEFPDLQAEKD